jgi:hypothetical protein
LQCLVYSFGVGGDHTFEDTLDKLGCTIHAYDPTMNQKEYKMSENIYFHPVGLSKNAFVQNG